MENEYVSRRDEIKLWQDRRFTVLAGSAGLVTGVLGLKVIDDPAEPDNSILGVALLLFFLCAACLLSWYAERSSFFSVR